MKNLKDKYQGCMVGLAVGDALGMPIETMDSDEIVEMFGRPLKDFIDPVDLKGRKHFCYHLKAGQYTDDTQLSIAIARSIIEKGGIEYEDIAKKHVEAYKEDIENTGRLRGWGRSTEHSVKRIMEGISWKESGNKGGAGNGTAMKISPLGLYACMNLSEEAMCEAAINISLMTHNDPRAMVAAIVQSYAVRSLIDSHWTGYFSKEKMIRNIATISEIKEHELGDTNNEISSKLKLIPQIKSVDEAIEKLGTGCYVPESLPFSLYMFQRDPFDFEKTLVETVNAGGDTDSNGSIVGALLGALNGYKKIPERWKSVEGHDLLLGIADRLYGIKP